ncbi:MAG: BTAD domain-containing putative transcriptional regulator [Nocardioides sp.]
MAIELHVIGCFGLSVDGVRTDISPVPARVLAYLSLQPGEVARPALASVLWPDVPHERALGNLRSALWRLPARTRPAVAETGTSLRLAEHVACDLGPVLRGAAATSADVAAVLAWAWCDELLAGWYDDWVLDAREALQVRRAVLLEGLAGVSSRAGRAGDALMFASLALAAQPLRESAQQALLRAHLDLGNHREAVALYRDFRRMLQHELGVGPSAETVAMMTAISSWVEVA